MIQIKSVKFLRVALAGFLGLHLVAGVSAAGAEDKQSFTFMFWNIENLFDTIDDPKKEDTEFTPEGSKKWTEEKMNAKMENLATVIKSVEGHDGKECPDFLGVAEIEHANIAKLFNKTQLKECGYKRIIIDNDDPDPRGIRVATFTRLPLAGKPRSHSPYEGGRFIQEVSVHVNENPVHIFINHWKSRIGGDVTSLKREKAGAVLRKRVREILEENPEADIIAMGDFNDDPEDKSLRSALGSTLNVHEFLDQLDTLVFWNPSSEILSLPAFEHGVDEPDEQAKYHKARATCYYSKEKTYHQFDNLLLSSGLLDDVGFRYQSRSYQVVRHPLMTDKQGRPMPFSKKGVGASDHFPVALKIFLDPSTFF